MALTEDQEAALAAIPQLAEDVAWVKRALGNRYEPDHVPGAQLTVGHDLKTIRLQTDRDR